MPHKKSEGESKKNKTSEGFLHRGGEGMEQEL